MIPSTQYDSILIDYISEGQWGIVGVKNKNNRNGKSSKRYTMIHTMENVLGLLNYMFEEFTDLSNLDYSEAAEMMIESESIIITRETLDGT